MSSQTPGWKLILVKSSFYNPSHPESAFTIGNYATLNKTDIPEKVGKFYSDYYGLDILKMVTICSGVDIAKLSKVLSNTEGNTISTKAKKRLVHLKAPIVKQDMVLFIHANQKIQIDIEFKINVARDHSDSLVFVLETAGKVLEETLIANKLALSSSINIEFVYDYTTVSFGIAPTMLGNRSLGAILQIVKASIDSVEKYLTDEEFKRLKREKLIEFYIKQKNSDAFSLTQSLLQNLQDYGVEKIFSGAFIPEIHNKKHIHDVFDALRTTKMIVSVIGDFKISDVKDVTRENRKEITASLEEILTGYLVDELFLGIDNPNTKSKIVLNSHDKFFDIIYGFKYLSTPLPPSPPISPLSPPSFTFPTSTLRIILENAAESESVELSGLSPGVVATEATELSPLSLIAASSQVAPKFFLSLLFTAKSCRAACAFSASIYYSVIARRIARVADAFAKVGGILLLRTASPASLAFTLAGYAGREMLEDVVRSVARAVEPSVEIGELREVMSGIWELMGKDAPPYQLAIEELGNIVDEEYLSNEEKIRIMREIHAQEKISSIPELYYAFEFLESGEPIERDIYAPLIEIFTKPGKIFTDALPVPKPSLNFPPASPHYFKVRNSADKNSCLLSCFVFRYPKPSAREKAVLLILTSLYQDSAFDYLRTTKQLGYVVQAKVTPSYPTMSGLTLIVQGEDLPLIEEEVVKHRTIFLEELKKKGSLLIDGHREKVKQNLTPTPGLDTANVHFTETVGGWGYGWHLKLIAEADNVRFEEVLALWENVMDEKTEHFVIKNK